MSFEMQTPDREKHRGANDHLRVLWVGTLSLGKGIQYLIEAARLLVHAPVEFLITGSMNVRPEPVLHAPSNVRWVGPTPAQRRRPVIPECRRVRSAYIIGWICDNTVRGACAWPTRNHNTKLWTRGPGWSDRVHHSPRDPKAIAQAILRFVDDRTLVETMAPKCRRTINAFSLDAYADRLIEMLRRRMAK